MIQYTQVFWDFMYFKNDTQVEFAQLNKYKKSMVSYVIS